MQEITEKDVDIIKGWQEEARKQTLETLPEFMNHVLNDYKHDYGTICRAIAACAVAAAFAADSSEQGGITGFQAGFIMWDFIRLWNNSSNECGMKLVDYDKMLYPQHEDYFKKTIRPHVMEKLTEEAKKKLKEAPYAHPEVVEHWKKLADGIPPFGYVVEKG